MHRVLDVLREAETGVTRAAHGPVSRLCEIFRGETHEMSPQNAERPGGGHPGRVVGGSGRLVGRLKPGRSKSSARQKLYLANDVRDHTDFSRARGAAIDRLFANDHRSCIVLGETFWADSEARVQTAPSGIMKKRKDGFSMFALLFGVGVALLMTGIGAEFFRVMSRIVSFVSSLLIFGFEIDPVFAPHIRIIH